jgi:hypothetical protein
VSAECQSILDSLGKRLSPQLLEHAAQCDDCRSLISTSRVMGPAAVLTLPASRVDCIHQKALAELARGRKSAPWWRDALVLVSINVLTAISMEATPHFNIIATVIHLWSKVVQKLGPASIALIFTVTLALGLMPMIGPWVALAPSRRRVKAAYGVLLGLLAAVSVGWYWKPRAHPDYVHDFKFCLLVELATSVVPIAFAFWVSRRRPYDSLRAGLSVMSCAMTGLFVTHMHCGVGTPFHLVFFHVLPWLALTALVIQVRARMRSTELAA